MLSRMLLLFLRGHKKKKFIIFVSSVLRRLEQNLFISLLGSGFIVGAVIVSLSLIRDLGTHYLVFGLFVHFLCASLVTVIIS